MRQPKPGYIIQNMRISLSAIINVSMETMPGADTQGMLNTLGPAIMKKVRDIPWVASVEAMGVEEIVPAMKSDRNH